MGVLSEMRKQLQKEFSAKLKRGDDRFNSALAKNKLAMPFEMYRHTSEKILPDVPIEIVRPEDFKGGIMVPVLGDTTKTNELLTSINGEKLERSGRLEGGPRYGQFNEGAIWASTPDATTKLGKGWLKLSRKYGEAPIYPTYVNQGPLSLYSGTNVSDILSEMLNKSEVSSKDAAQFEEEVRSLMGGKKGKKKLLMPDFPSIEDENLAQYMKDKSFDSRRALANTVGKAKYQKMGFPEPASIGIAATDPGVFGKPFGSSGYIIGEANLDDLIDLNPANPHTTYAANLNGLVRGGFEENIPARKVWAPSFASRKKESSDPRWLMMNQPKIGRFMDQQAIDEMSDYIEAVRRLRTEGFAEGGLYTDEERARRAEEQMGGVTPDGYASSLPPPNGGNYADGGLVNGDRNRLDSIISDFLSDNPGQYAELGEPQELRRMMRQERRRPAEFQLDLGGGSTDSNDGFGGGGHAGMRLPIGPAMLSIDAVGGGGFGQQVNPEEYLGRGPRGPVMRVGKSKFGGGANLAGIQAAIEGLPGLAGRYGISYDTQPFMLTQTLGLDERGMPRATRADLIGGQGMGNNQRIWDRMLPDEKLMFTYNREF